MGTKPCLTCGQPTRRSYCPEHDPYQGPWRRQSEEQRRTVPWCQCPGCPACTPTGCGTTHDLSADHVVNGETQLQTLCRPCNSSKA